MRQGFLYCGLSRDQLRRIIKSHVYDTGCSKELGAMLIRMSTYGDDQIKLDLPQLLHRVGLMRADIDPGLLHDRHSVRVQPVFLDSGRIWLDMIGYQFARPSFRHLAAA